MNLIADLQARQIIQDLIPGTEEQLNKEMTAGYIGFDPTADSLHVGSLLPITLLMRLQKAGHKPYVLVGGATGRVGDPSGKTSERQLLSVEQIEANCAGIKKQLEKFLDFEASHPNAAVMINNFDWFKDFSFLDFIRDVGKFITINYMMAKDSVQKRLESGMSFTEFTYQLIQGFDFYYLHQNHGVKLQMGGADQWGNIVTGTELIRKKGSGEAFALTCKLVTKSDGSKFGKSEGGNIWLDPSKTSPYQFYQFWLKLSDEDAAKMAYNFSFETKETIDNWITEHQTNPGLRSLQKHLAAEMTTMVHSAQDLDFAVQASNILFGKAPLEALTALSETQLLEVMEGVPQVAFESKVLATTDLVSFLAEAKVVASKGEGKKLIQNNGISINKQKVNDPSILLSEFELLQGKYLLIQKGKSSYTLAIFN